jgi:hypothetical protein
MLPPTSFASELLSAVALRDDVTAWVGSIAAAFRATMAGDAASRFASRQQQQRRRRQRAPRSARPAQPRFGRDGIEEHRESDDALGESGDENTEYYSDSESDDAGGNNNNNNNNSNIKYMGAAAAAGEGAKSPLADTRSLGRRQDAATLAAVLASGPIHAAVPRIISSCCETLRVEGDQVDLGLGRPLAAAFLRDSVVAPVLRGLAAHGRDDLARVIDAVEGVGKGWEVLEAAAVDASRRTLLSGTRYDDFYLFIYLF